MDRDLPDIPPDIEFKVDQDESEFYRDMQRAIESIDGYSSELRDLWAGARYLAISLPDDDLHDNSVAQFFFKDNETRVIRVELQSSGWLDRPTKYEDYKNFAGFILNPILVAYSAVADKNAALEITSVEDMEPSMQEAADGSFQLFLRMANKGGLHPLDWGRFYSFVRVCESSSEPLSETDLNRILQQSGFDAEYSNLLSAIYYHGRQILQSDS